MRMDLGLSQTIKQIQTLSPQMYMSMEILCLNSLDLEERIDQEMEENIALEVEEGAPKEEGADGGEDGAPEVPSQDDPGMAEPAEAANAESAETKESADAFDRKVEEWDEYSREDYQLRSGRIGGDDDRDDKLEALQNTAGRSMTLQEYLEQQIHLLPDERFGSAHAFRGEAKPLLFDLCIAIVYNIDERGYLMYSPDEIYQSLVDEAEGKKREPAGAAGDAPGDATPAVAVQAPSTLGGASTHPEEPNEAGYRPLTCVPERALFDHALSLIQSLDPPGVGGRDLRECLLLQLRRDRQSYPVETAIIESHLEDLGSNRIPKIAKVLGISVEDVKSAVETIASLNPIPGKLFGGEGARFIKPDVVVDDVEGEYVVRVLSESLPRLQVSSYYRDLYRSAAKDPVLKQFVKKKLESAEWLIAAIRQRQSTLHRVAQEIIGIQRGFLDHGISHLKPLKMVEVAERVGVHVSTISRAISGKYVQTPRGIFDLKYFFTGGSEKEDGTTEARGSVIQRIRDLVQSEDAKNPLSDIDIVEKLSLSGIHISRRTVTKYREAESIPSSRQRRAY